MFKPTDYEFLIYGWMWTKTVFTSFYLLGRPTKHLAVWSINVIAISIEAYFTCCFVCALSDNLPAEYGIHQLDETEWTIQV